MPEEKRRPLGDGAVLLGGERPVPTETPNDPQPGNASDPAIAKARHAKLRSRLAAAADYAQDLCASALSPCSRDLAWWICRIGNRYADNTEVPVRRNCTFLQGGQAQGRRHWLSLWLRPSPWAGIGQTDRPRIQEAS